MNFFLKTIQIHILMFLNTDAFAKVLQKKTNYNSYTSN